MRQLLLPIFQVFCCLILITQMFLVIKKIAETTVDGNIRYSSQAIVDVAEKKDLKSVNVKVEKTQEEVK
jgi:hypothetical protein